MGVSQQRGSSVSNNAETLAYAALRTTANDPASLFELAILDQFITKGKKDGWWDEIIEVYPWMGSTVAGVSVKGKYFTSSSLTLTGFSDSDFTDTSKGFGTYSVSNSTKYATTGLDPVAAGLSQTNLFVLLSILSDDTPNSTGDSGGFVLAIEHTDSAANGPVFGAKTLSSGFGSEFGGSIGQGIKLINYTASKRTNTKNHSLCNSITGAQASYATSLWGDDVKLFRVTRFGSIDYVYGFIGITIIANALTDAQVSSIFYAANQFDSALGRINNQKSLVSFGDSITAGSSTAMKENFTTLLSKKFGIPNKNMGISSSRLITDSNSPNFRSGLARWGDIFDYDPAMVVIVYGTNDIGASVATATFEDSLDDIVTWLSTYTDGRGITAKAITVCSIPYRTPAGFYSLAKQNEYLESVRSIAVVRGVNFADLWGMLYSAHMNGVTVLADSTHPNAAGHALIYRAIMEANGERNFIGLARGIDLNVTNIDRAIHIFGSKYRISKIVLSSPSGDLTASSATAEIRDAAAGAGNVISTVAWTGLSANTKANEQTVAAHDILTGPLYFRVGTGHGSAACVNAFVYGEVLE